MKFVFPLFALFIFASCSVSKKLERSAREDVLRTEALKTAHVGIGVYEPATGKWWYNYQGDKYFVPASNTKIPTCYAAMKYLGDSLVGLRYEYVGNDLLIIQPTGDPTFLHPDFASHPAFDFFKNIKGHQINIANSGWQEDALGAGWSWNDYNEAYMAERSMMPIYGNVVHFKHNGKAYVSQPKYFKVFNERTANDLSAAYDSLGNKFGIIRDRSVNNFSLKVSNRSNSDLAVPFVSNASIITALLTDTLKRSFFIDNVHLNKTKKAIRSQPTDSLLRPMMHRSDNFFAEQSLLMVSNELLGFMNDEKIIDTLLKTDFKDLPQKPRWVDGSGLSRYNLFTPEDFVFILNKMKNEFGMQRLKNIFATGGEGTLSNYYVKEKDFLYAKTGTLSGVVALSGFLTTQKGKELIFSVQVNNHNGSATEVRRAVEKFVQGLRERY